MPEPAPLSDRLREAWSRVRYAHRRRPGARYSLAGCAACRCVFVHVPKAGGVSVNRALFGTLGAGHRTVRDYKRMLGPLTYRRYFSFTFVRNPYTRLVSAYTFLERGGFDAADAAWAAERLAGVASFEAFVTDWLTPATMREKLHLQPQHHFLCDGDGPPDVDFVGRFETLDRDFARVAERLGRDVALPHANATGRRQAYEAFYTPALFERVAELYARDFELFGYDASDYALSGATSS